MWWMVGVVVGLMVVVVLLFCGVIVFFVEIFCVEDCGEFDGEGLVFDWIVVMNLCNISVLYFLGLKLGVFILLLR